MESHLTYFLLQLRTAQMANHTYVQHVHRLHQKQELYERYQYHLTLLHSHQPRCNVPSCAAWQPYLQPPHREPHTLFPQARYPYMTQALYKPYRLLLKCRTSLHSRLTRPLQFPLQEVQVQYQEVHLQEYMYNHL